MKIRNGYGSEHSMNLVLIGKFKNAQDAEKVVRDIDRLSAQVSKDSDDSVLSDKPENQRFSDEMLTMLRSINIHSLAPNELEQLVSDYHLKREDCRITVRTDEADVSAFIKLFIDAGAKVEIFSAHEYPADSDDAI